MFCKVVLKTFAIFTGKHLCWSLFWRLQHRYFPVNTVNFLRTSPILKNISLSTAGSAAAAAFFFQDKYGGISTFFSEGVSNSNIQFKKFTHNKFKSNKCKFSMTRSSRGNCKTAKSTPTKRTTTEISPSNNHSSSPKHLSSSSDKSLLEKEQKDIAYLIKKARYLEDKTPKLEGCLLLPSGLILCWKGKLIARNSIPGDHGWQSTE